MVIFPARLRPGDLIAVTAPSSGVPPGLHTRLDLAIEHLRSLGFRVIEGSCLRAQARSASAARGQRAAELNRFLIDPEVAAIIPPWGGELATGLLELLDFDIGHMPPQMTLINGARAHVTFKAGSGTISQAA